MTDEAVLRRRARGLIRIGEVGIAGGDTAAVDAYYSADFVLHGPGGDRSLSETMAFFGAMRAAFPDLTVARSEITGSGDLLAARSVMAGTFSAVLSSDYGDLPPTGGAMRLEIVGLMRFDDDGRLAEEWLQYDRLGFFRQLGLMLVPRR